MCYEYNKCEEGALVSWFDFDPETRSLIYRRGIFETLLDRHTAVVRRGDAYFVRPLSILTKIKGVSNERQQ